ncbi:hypothetical protein CVAR_0390 [Corynebacterium variabile DSM 44702]|uniref:Uncharacterized protein n=1 Tax=Corynebacterium variabile (strain DSM 44702 / CIP 107183 / JCM 12073 / NCIMB 30131) TaxID=858619 RepID=G0HA34_CORVD|nr:hypothetical protein CVAR_0390 [Corynebacterium variabile DSM 44702]
MCYDLRNRTSSPVTVADCQPPTDTLRSWYDALEIVLVIWLVTGPVWQLFSRPAAEHSTPR